MHRAPVAAFLIFMLAVTAAIAGGLGDDHGDGTDTIFFGVVQDTRGVAISNARVNVIYKKMSFVTTSDAIGGYRIAVPEIDAAGADIACRKDGYAPSAINRRPPASADRAPIEVDCILKKDP